MEITTQSSLALGTSVLIPGPPILPSLPEDAADILCMPMLQGSSTGTSMALGGSANNCLDS